MSERLPEGWSLDDGRNAATYASEHRDVHVELTHDELCVGTQESYRGSGDRTAAFIPLPVLLRLLGALEYKVIGPEDAAVLRTAAGVHERWLRAYVGAEHIDPLGLDPLVAKFVHAELARRAAKETPRG